MSFLKYLKNFGHQCKNVLWQEIHHHTLTNTFTSPIKYPTQLLINKNIFNSAWNQGFHQNNFNIFNIDSHKNETININLIFKRNMTKNRTKTPS